MLRENITFFTALGGGILYFFSPCTLPLIPSYFSYITGISLEELREGRESRLRIFLHSIFFLAGLSLIFVVLGAGATLLGRALTEYLGILRKVGGVIIIFFGLFLVGAFRIPFLQRTLKLNWSRKPTGFLGSFLVGISFSAGWTACSTPILASILIYASTLETVRKGVILLSFFSLGLSIPFLLSSLFLNFFLKFLKKFTRYIRWVEIISGLFLIVLGILLLTNLFSFLSAWSNQWLSR